MKTQYFFYAILLFFLSLGTQAQKPTSVIYEDLKKLPLGSYVMFTDTLTISAHETVEDLNCSPDGSRGLPYDIEVLVDPSKKMRQIPRGKKYKVQSTFLVEPSKEYLAIELKKDLFLKIKYTGAFAIRSTTELLEYCGDRLFVDIEKIKKM